MFGIDPTSILSGGGPGIVGEQQAGKTGTPSDEAGQFVDTITSSTTDVWKEQFAKRGQQYTPPSTVLYEQYTGTRCGMGACQGRICGGALEVLRGWPRTSVRPPVSPTRMGHLG